MLSSSSIGCEYFWTINRRRKFPGDMFFFFFYHSESLFFGISRVNKNKGGRIYVLAPQGWLLQEKWIWPWYVEIDWLVGCWSHDHFSLCEEPDRKGERDRYTIRRELIRSNFHSSSAICYTITPHAVWGHSVKKRQARDNKLVFIANKLGFQSSVDTSLLCIHWFQNCF